MEDEKTPPEYRALLYSLYYQQFFNPVALFHMECLRRKFWPRDNENNEDSHASTETLISAVTAILHDQQGPDEVRRLGALLNGVTKSNLYPHATADAVLGRVYANGAYLGEPRFAAYTLLNRLFKAIDMGFYNTHLKTLLINPKLEKARYLRVKDALSLKADNPKNPITSLSGGNQQKVILGRWLETNANVLIFDNPTQGIDVGTKFEIYHLILKLAQSGKAILVFSQEFPEIFKVADSCIVMYKGQINAVLNREQLTEKNMMYYSTGSNLEGKKHGSTSFVCLIRNSYVSSRCVET